MEKFLAASESKILPLVAILREMSKKQNKLSFEEIYEASEAFGMRHWYDLGYEICEGSFPSKAEVAEALKGQVPVPSPIRMFLADFLEGNIEWSEDTRRRKIRPHPFYITSKFLNEYKAAKQLTKLERDNRTPKRHALHKTAKAYASAFGQHVGADTIEKMVYSEFNDIRKSLAPVILDDRPAEEILAELYEADPWDE